ncbi:MAG: DNA-3-methyladenine glycosylase I, partial [Spirochaetia bacterium]
MEYGVEPYVGADGKARCPWCYGSELYETYHDTEWGVPVHEDRVHFEFLVLEAFQAGLSWLTVLRKRERFRERFAGFEPSAVASLSDAELEDIRQDPGVIRNKAKIRAARTNARAFLDVCSKYGSFDRFIWSYVDGQPLIQRPATLSEVPATTPLSDRI